MATLVTTPLPLEEPTLSDHSNAATPRAGANDTSVRSFLAQSLTPFEDPPSASFGFSPSTRRGASDPQETELELLRRRVAQLEKQAAEDARTIQELVQQVVTSEDRMHFAEEQVDLVWEKGMVPPLNRDAHNDIVVPLRRRVQELEGALAQATSNAVSEMVKSRDAVRSVELWKLRFAAAQRGLDDNEFASPDVAALMRATAEPDWVHRLREVLAALKRDSHSAGPALRKLVAPNSGASLSTTTPASTETVPPPFLVATGERVPLASVPPKPGKASTSEARDALASRPHVGRSLGQRAAREQPQLQSPAGRSTTSTVRPLRSPALRLRSPEIGSRGSLGSRQAAIPVSSSLTTNGGPRRPGRGMP
mmetsp:Transcript_25040/g.63933  ORF Transcript_25040/g.63933 Transcript_25040/m.63933 type:complete len:365 (-) Transcript_25040:292-1386(-)